MFKMIVLMLCTAARDAAWDVNSLKHIVKMENVDAINNFLLLMNFASRLCAVAPAFVSGKY